MRHFATALTGSSLDGHRSRRISPIELDTLPAPALPISGIRASLTSQNDEDRFLFHQA